jgi:hypothetical protein
MTLLLWLFPIFLLWEINQTDIVIKNDVLRLETGLLLATSLSREDSIGSNEHDHELRVLSSIPGLKGESMYQWRQVIVITTEQEIAFVTLGDVQQNLWRRGSCRDSRLLLSRKRLLSLFVVELWVSWRCSLFSAENVRKRHVSDRTNVLVASR